MKRQITGLHSADCSAADQIPEGLFLVRVQKVHFRRQAAEAVLHPCDGHS